MNSPQVKNSIRQCDLIVTENCSLRCKICHIWKHHKPDELVSLEEYAGFLRSLRDFTGKDTQIQFVGGEPLLKKRITELISLAAHQGFCTTMTTNGFLLDREMADRLISSGLHTLGFSLESMTPGTHDFLRGVPGVHAKVMDALDYFASFSASPVQLFIASIITGANLDDTLELAEWVNAQPRINFIYFQAVMQPFAMPGSDTWYEDESCRFLWPDPDKAAGVLDELSRRKKSGYKIANHAAQFEVFKTYFRQPQRFVKRTKCNLGYDSFTVLPDGNIFLCLALEPIGNIKTDHISQVWFSEKAQKVRTQIAQCTKNCKLMVNCFFEDENNEQ
ncbi:MAG TPA: radical SAM protein [Patescibacteria group bacterium]|nr:radical SAM protein [Patescibacteria group bacterium]